MDRDTLDLCWDIAVTSIARMGRRDADAFALARSERPDFNETQRNNWVLIRKMINGSACGNCGSDKPVGQSCGCFDNGGQ